MMRVLDNLFLDANRFIDQRGSDRDEDLRQVRLVIKRSRSYLRLLRPVMGETTYFRENRKLRSSGRRLSMLRDTHVAQATLQQWSRRVTRPSERRALQAVMESLARQLTQAHPMGAGRDNAMKRVGAELLLLRGRLPDWTLNQTGWEALRPGLKNTFRRARRCMRVALKTNHDDDYHDWRRHTKDLFFHLQLLAGAWPESLRTFGQRLHELQKRIGQDHDIGLVVNLLKEDPVFRADPELRRVCKKLASQSGKLREAIESEGRKLFDRSPGKFTKRLEKHWVEWVGDTAQER